MMYLTHSRSYFKNCSFCDVADIDYLLIVSILSFINRNSKIVNLLDYALFCSCI